VEDRFTVADLGSLQDADHLAAFPIVIEELNRDALPDICRSDRM
jgi:hypothetical protein